LQALISPFYAGSIKEKHPNINILGLRAAKNHARPLRITDCRHGLSASQRQPSGGSGLAALNCSANPGS
jgi:hypothetical protein